MFIQQMMSHTLAVSEVTWQLIFRFSVYITLIISVTWLPCNYYHASCDCHVIYLQIPLVFIELRIPVIQIQPFHFIYILHPLNAVKVLINVQGLLTNVLWHFTVNMERNVWTNNNNTIAFCHTKSFMVIVNFLHLLIRFIMF